jgi:hypothetical protein
MKVTLAQKETSPKKEVEAAEQREPKSRQSFVGSLTDKNNFSETFVRDWKSVLNKKAMSDLTIYVEEDKEISAHKLVLYVRCEAILKDVVSEVSSEGNKKSSDMLMWIDVPYQAALAFLQFLYCGHTSKIIHLVEEDLLSVKRLAQRYQVMELLQYLQVVNGVRARVNKSSDSSPNLAKYDTITYHRHQNSLNPVLPSKQCARAQAVHSPSKHTYTKDTSDFHDQSRELTGKSVSPVSSQIRDINSKEIHVSAESELCSTGSASPDLFLEDVGECDEEHVETLSQESRNSMDCLLSLIDKPSLSQSNTQTNSTVLCQVYPTVSSIQPSPSLQKCGTSPVTVINVEVSIPNDVQINSSSQSYDNKCILSGEDLSCVEHDVDTQNKYDFLPPTLGQRNYMDTSESISNTSSVKIKAQGNLLGSNSENVQQSSQSEVCNECIPLQDSKEMTVEAESTFDSIDFLEHLLSDSHTKTSSKYIQRDVNRRGTSKRKHSGSNTASDCCSSLVKKTCRHNVQHETVETFSGMTELNERSDKMNNIEGDVIETFDLTQSSTGSESIESQGLTLTSPVRKSIVGTNIETVQKSTVATKEYSDLTICNYEHLSKKSAESNTTDGISKSEHLHNNRVTRVEENAMTVEQEENVQEDTPIQLDNMQVHDDWDKYDEMCHASVPYIFSQCLSQLLSTEYISQKSVKSRISSSNSRRSLSLSPSHLKSPIQGSIPNLFPSCSSSPVRKAKKASKNMKEPSSVSNIHESPRVKDVLENSLLAQLNESVFWRDENAPTLRMSPKPTTPANHTNIADHRTPTQRQMNLDFSDRVTPPVDYSAMKTPQLKVYLFTYFSPDF